VCVCACVCVCLCVCVCVCELIEAGAAKTSQLGACVCVCGVSMRTSEWLCFQTILCYHSEKRVRKGLYICLCAYWHLVCFFAPTPLKRFSCTHSAAQETRTKKGSGQCKRNNPLSRPPFFFSFFQVGGSPEGVQMARSQFYNQMPQPHSYSPGLNVRMPHTHTHTLTNTHTHTHNFPICSRCIFVCACMSCNRCYVCISV